MVNYTNGTKQLNYFKVLIVVLAFLLLSFNWELALTYVVILLANKWWFESDDFISFPISRKGSSIILVIIESLAGLGIFLATSTFLLSAFAPESLINTNGIAGNVQSIIHLLASTTPILKGSKFLTFISWAILVPIMETIFFNGSLLEGLAKYSEPVFGKKVSLNKFTKEVWFIILLVAALFTLFHITAKGIASIPLLITFIFSVISSILVIRHKELKGAILLHICVNGAAVLSSFGQI